MTAILIRGGSVANHDHSHRADVLVDGETIVAIGPAVDAPAGAEMIDATGCYVMPGGIDPHTHLEMPFMGTYSADDFESGTRAALAAAPRWSSISCLPEPGQSLLEALRCGTTSPARRPATIRFHMAITWWGEQVCDEMAEVVKTTASPPSSTSWPTRAR